MVRIAKDEPGEAAGHKWSKAHEVVDVPEHVARVLLIVPGFHLVGSESPIDYADPQVVNVPVPGSVTPKRTLIHEAAEDETPPKADADDPESGEEVDAP